MLPYFDLAVMLAAICACLTTLVLGWHAWHNPLPTKEGDDGW